MGRQSRPLCGMVADADCRRLTPLHAAGWLINKYTRPIERLSRNFSLPRGVSSEAEFPRAEAPWRRRRGDLERGGDCPRYEGPRQRALERGGVCARASYLSYGR